MEAITLTLNPWCSLVYPPLACIGIDEEAYRMLGHRVYYVIT